MWPGFKHLRNLCGTPVLLGSVLACTMAIAGAAAEDNIDVLRTVRQLQEQNQSLLKQLGQQQQLIETLGRKVSVLENASTTSRSASALSPGADDARPEHLGMLGQVKLTGEGAVGFYSSGSRGQFPNHEFRVDEARLFLEAPLFDDIYFAGEINLVTRENPGIDVGELYLEFENLSRWWGQSDQLNLRAGRFDIPFGEEYQVRHSIDNPLVSHSLSDLWGVDEGVELYGKLGAVRYAVAVQNGGHPEGRDYNGDKSVAGRVSYDPLSWLHLSASGMRTGDLDVAGDQLSELWFGSAFIRALGAPTNTTTFHADVFEGDVQIKIPRGHLKFAGGRIHSTDNSPARNTGRDVYYYYGEAMQKFLTKWYAAARFSQILAHRGYPIVGNGDFGKYFYSDLTTDLRRLSLGLGYHVAPGLVLKAEFSLQEGRTLSGEKRLHENLVALEAAFKF